MASTPKRRFRGAVPMVSPARLPGRPVMTHAGESASQSGTQAASLGNSKQPQLRCLFVISPPLLALGPPPDGLGHSFHADTLGSSHRFHSFAGPCRSPATAQTTVRRVRGGSTEPGLATRCFGARQCVRWGKAACSPGGKWAAATYFCVYPSREKALTSLRSDHDRISGVLHLGLSPFGSWIMVMGLRASRRVMWLAP